MLQNPWIPDHIKTGITTKQAEFLSYEGREALYGGAAGGGKSVAILVAALQYADEPGYAALIMRRKFTQLDKADSILDKAKQWLLPNAKVKWNSQQKKFTFRSGSTLEFGHMEHENDKYNYLGGIWSFIGVDECTQFTDQMLAYPRTRQRRLANSLVPIRWRGASNPGNIGHDYIKERYIKDKLGKDPSTPDRQFFPAKLEDNPHIDRPDYIKQLQESGIDGILLEQLLRGDWDAVAGGQFKREWFGSYYVDRRNSPDFIILRNHAGDEIERFNFHHRPRFSTCDPAASASTAADHFVLSTFLLSPKANLLWWDCERDKLEITEQVTTCQNSYRRHRPSFLAVEEVMNQRSLAQILRKSTNPPMVIHGVTPGGRRKLDHALAAIILASSGRIFLPIDNPRFPLDDVVSELTRFTGIEGEDASDDIVDTLSYGAEMLPAMGWQTSGRPISRWSPAALEG